MSDSPYLKLTADAAANRMMPRLSPSLIESAARDGYCAAAEADDPGAERTPWNEASEHTQGIWRAAARAIYLSIAIEAGARVEEVKPEG